MNKKGRKKFCGSNREKRFMIDPKQNDTLP